MWLDVDLPALSMVTLFGSVSNPVTLWPASAKRRAQRQPNVSAANDGDFQLSTLKNSGFRLWHELRRSPRYFGDHCRPFGRLDKDTSI